MVARNLISSEITPLTVEQTGKDAFYLLSEHAVRHLPVVENGKLIGLISEEDIFNHHLYEPIGDYDFSMLRRSAVQAEDHVFEIIRIMGEHRLTVLPVVDADRQHLGLIHQADIIAYLAESSSFSMPGAILVLAMQKSDYSMGTISRIAEQENIHVLSSAISSKPEDEVLEVTLKLNQPNINGLVASFERHGYTVRESYNESGYKDSLQERYDGLMRYLEV